MENTGQHKKKLAIIGGGPAALILAAELDTKKYSVSIFEKNTALGRKFLVAGKGGFNLTHAEPIDKLVTRYIPPGFLDTALFSFSNSHFRYWLSNIGIETYIGTSKRIFPVKGTKPIEVLKAIEKRLKQNSVQIFYEHEWIGFDSQNELVFATNQGNYKTGADLIVFALGGASWKVTGSSGNWLKHFNEKGVATRNFEPSNCAFKVDWPSGLQKEIEGKAIKNCVFNCGDKTHTGEAVLTSFGIEGSGVYPLSNEIRKQLSEKGKAELFMDLKPGITEEELTSRFVLHSKLNIKEILLQKINLSELQFTLIKHSTSKEQYTNASYLSRLIKHFPISVTGIAPIDEAISSVGGIELSEVNEQFELKKLSRHYCIGEMLDWDAPTGGYLLQACFSMGKYLADHLNLKP